MKLSGWLLSLSIEESNDRGISLSDCSTSELRDEDYDADVSSNCDHSNKD